jgi:predicted NBD/HSP70 family sugar kinase
MRIIETEEAARRLARAIASDLSLYNEEKILNGLKNDNLYGEISQEIEEGRELFRSRVTPELFDNNFYDRAIIDLLIKSKGHIKCKLW